MLVKKLLTLCAFCTFAFCAQVQADEVTDKPQEKQKQLNQEEVAPISEKCPCTKEKCPCPKQKLAHVEQEKPKNKKEEVVTEPVKVEETLAACPNGKCPAPAPVKSKDAKDAKDAKTPVQTEEAAPQPEIVA